MWRVKHFLEVTAVEQIILAYQHLKIIDQRNLLETPPQ